MSKFDRRKFIKTTSLSAALASTPSLYSFKSDNPADFKGDSKKTKIVRQVKHSLNQHTMKLDFLKLDGTDITSSSGLAEKGHLLD